ncbi:MAG TPA: DEAD/DEAH box helicase family protein [Bacillota bacterium]|nr:DEAD/DEAH box helicase family protein [Bacillota bacterium]
MSKIKLVTENLLDELIKSIDTASGVYLIISFVMESGVRLLEESLLKALNRGAEIKILAGDYLFVTQPEGLRRCFQLDPRIEVRLWRSNGTSFHPKAYLIQNGDQDGCLIVGSSNLSRSALIHGVEWNLVMQAAVEPTTFQSALEHFMRLFNHEATIPINSQTIQKYEQEYEEYHQKCPSLIRTWVEEEAKDIMYGMSTRNEISREVRERTTNYTVIVPREAQKQALKELEKTLEEGYNKAMVVMATGLGKTYLAGFFAQQFKRILFIAHREEILMQAQKSFKHIMPSRSYGIYNGVSKAADAECVFASIYTLGMKQHRETFPPDSFDLIVIDEFHHAAAPTYQRILDYFTPKFLLGITATPDRLDGKDVYALCDGNVAYQLHFLEAIQKGWLTPFHYYGVYDQTDYSKIPWLGNRYSDEELLFVQLKEEMAQTIFEAWMKYKQTRTLGFCSSIKQANFLANFFREKGFSALSLHSKTMEMSRGEAIHQLETGALDIIFTVGLFNEGVDIPSVDTLLFARPTESLTIFTQQIGRGLRLSEGKNYCTIIDLIGNYRNADVKIRLFDTKSDSFMDKRNATALIEPVIPEFCRWEIDIEAINLLKELARKKQPRKEKLREAYYELKNEIGRRPTYLELHLQGNVDSKAYKQEFKSYVGFLYWADDLDDREIEIFKRVEPWLKEVEGTGMAKSYKMIVLLYMLEKGMDRWLEPVTPEEVASFFHSYLTEKEYRKKKDFSDSKTQKLWNFDLDKTAKLVAEMPMSMWSGSSKGLVTFSERVFRLNFDIVREDREFVYNCTKEICLYRLHWHFERNGRSMICWNK